MNNSDYLEYLMAGFIVFIILSVYASALLILVGGA